MLGTLNLLAAVPRSHVACDDLVLFDNPNVMEVSKDGKGALRPVVRNRVVVEIEPSVGRFPDLNVEAVMGGEWLGWERQQFASLVVEGFTDGARRVFCPLALGRTSRHPLV